MRNLKDLVQGVYTAGVCVSASKSGHLHKPEVLGSFMVEVTHPSVLGALRWVRS